MAKDDVLPIQATLDCLHDADPDATLDQLWGQIVRAGVPVWAVVDDSPPRWLEPAELREYDLTYTRGVFLKLGGHHLVLHNLKVESQAILQAIVPPRAAAPLVENADPAAIAQLSSKGQQGQKRTRVKIVLRKCILPASLTTSGSGRPFFSTQSEKN